MTGPVIRYDPSGVRAARPYLWMQLKGKPETGMLPAGMILSRLRVTATEVSLSGISHSAFSRRIPVASSRWPNGRYQNSRYPCLSPDT